MVNINSRYHSSKTTYCSAVWIPAFDHRYDPMKQSVLPLDSPHSTTGSYRVTKRWYQSSTSPPCRALIPVSDEFRCSWSCCAKTMERSQRDRFPIPSRRHRPRCSVMMGARWNERRWIFCCTLRAEVCFYWSTQPCCQLVDKHAVLKVTWIFNECF